MPDLTTSSLPLVKPAADATQPLPRPLPLTVTTRPRLMVSILLASDLTMLAATMLAAVYVRLLFGGAYESELYLRLYPVLGLYLGVYACVGLYPAVPLSPVSELRRLTIVTSLLFLGLAMTVFLFREGYTYSRSVFLISWALALVMVPLSRAVLRILLAGRPWWGYPAIIVGGGTCGAAAVRTLRRQMEIGLKPVGVIDDHVPLGQHISGVPVIGTLQESEHLDKKHSIRYAILAMGDIEPTQSEMLIRKLSRSFHHLIVIPQLTGFSSLWVSGVDLGGILGLEVRHRLLDPGRRALKRVIDIALIVLFCPILIPLVGLISLAIRLDSHGPVIYDQQRIGGAGHRFRIKKFRSMVVNADGVLAQYLDQHPHLREEWERTHKLRDDPRITRVGRFLRKTSLDELPQLWNVLIGHMSLVGPRPIVDDEVTLYGRDFDLIQQVCPGITGIWQVSGRNNVTYEERVDMDAYYVRNWSVWLDIYLLSRTVLAVLLRRGAY